MASAANTQELQLLLDRANAGDAAAKKALFNRSNDRMLLIARKHLNAFTRMRGEGETLDFLNTAYLRLHESVDAVKPPTVRQLMGLVSVQVRRVLLDAGRKVDGRGEARPKMLHMPAGDRDDSSAAPLEPADNASPLENLLREDVLNAVERLPGEELEVVDLIYLHELPRREVAELLEVHEDTVARRLARAMVKLALALEQ